MRSSNPSDGSKNEKNDDVPEPLAELSSAPRNQSTQANASSKRPGAGNSLNGTPTPGCAPNPRNDASQLDTEVEPLSEVAKLCPLIEKAAKQRQHDLQKAEERRQTQKNESVEMDTVEQLKLQINQLEQKNMELTAQLLDTKKGKEELRPDVRRCSCSDKQKEKSEHLKAVEAKNVWLAQEVETLRNFEAQHLSEATRLKSEINRLRRDHEALRREKDHVLNEFKKVKEQQKAASPAANGARRSSDFKSNKNAVPQLAPVSLDKSKQKLSQTYSDKNKMKLEFSKTVKEDSPTEFGVEETDLAGNLVDKVNKLEHRVEEIRKSMKQTQESIARGESFGFYPDENDMSSKIDDDTGQESGLGESPESDVAGRNGSTKEDTRRRTMEKLVQKVKAESRTTGEWNASVKAGIIEEGDIKTKVEEGNGRKQISFGSKDDAIGNVDAQTGIKEKRETTENTNDSEKMGNGVKKKNSIDQTDPIRKPDRGSMKEHGDKYEPGDKIRTSVEGSKPLRVNHGTNPSTQYDRHSIEDNGTKPYGNPVDTPVTPDDREDPEFKEDATSTIKKSKSMSLKGNRGSRGSNGMNKTGEANSTFDATSLAPSNPKNRDSKDNEADSCDFPHSKSCQAEIHREKRHSRRSGEISSKSIQRCKEEHADEESDVVLADKNFTILLEQLGKIQQQMLQFHKNYDLKLGMMQETINSSDQHYEKILNALARDLQTIKDSIAKRFQKAKNGEENYCNQVPSNHWDKNQKSFKAEQDFEEKRPGKHSKSSKHSKEEGFDADNEQDSDT